MSEHLKNRHESQEHEAKHEIEAKNLPDIEQLNQEALDKATDAGKVEHLQDTAAEKATSSKEISVETDDKPTKQEFGAYAELKGQTYSRTLKRVQGRLSAPERTMSKVMHNKTLEKVSDGLGKTAARPSGILGGGIVALLGSFVVLYMAKKYGFEYNFLMFFVFLAGGFVLGVLLEFVIYAVKKAKR